MSKVLDRIDIDDFRIDYLGNTLTNKELGVKYKCSPTTVWAMAKELGLVRDIRDKKCENILNKPKIEWTDEMLSRLSEYQMRRLSLKELCEELGVSEYSVKMKVRLN